MRRKRGRRAAGPVPSLTEMADEPQDLPAQDPQAPLRRIPGELDELDSGIVRELQEDGRRSYREIARKLGVAEGTVRWRARRLTDSGVVRVVAIPDPFRLGYRVLAFVLIQVEPGRQRHVIEALTTFPEATYVSSLTGRADIYMQIVCRDHDHLFELLSDRIPAIGGITGAETFTELKMYKLSYVYPGLAGEPG